jgi:hypothetical protein
VGSTKHLFRITGLLIVSSFIVLSCTSLSPVDGKAERLVASASPETVLPRWQSVSVSGLDYVAGKVSRPRLEFYALRLDLSNPALRIVAAGGKSAADGTFLSTKVSSFVRDNSLLAGINALPFDKVSGREGEPRVNVGIVIADGVMLSPPHANFDALVFYADGAGVVAQSAIHSAENITNAVGGFHRILSGGEPVPRVLGLEARHPRSAAGLSSDGRYLYLLAIDGRRPGSVGSTEAETALLLRALGASEGINFDGGGSTALVLRYPDGKIRAVNTPIHRQIPGRERAVAGCLGIKVD